MIAGLHSSVTMRGMNMLVSTISILVVSLVVLLPTVSTSVDDNHIDSQKDTSSQDEHRIASGLEDSPLIGVRVVSGGRAFLPCDVTPKEPNDAPFLVLIYRGVLGTPIYSVDGRGSSLSEGSHWSDALVLGSRAWFTVGGSQGHGLTIEDVEHQDKGDYRCRVDFRDSPSRNVRVNLDVVVPPSNLVVIDDTGHHVGSIAGPYPEGTEVKLSCQVTGGDPAPTVTWWRNGLLIDNAVDHSDRNHITQNDLIVPSLTRDSLNQKFTCEASNSNLTASLMAEVSLDVSFAPVEVRLLNLSDDVSVSEGDQLNISCQVTGSRPPARISWWIDHKIIEQGHHMSVNVNGNVSVGYLSMVASAEDNGSKLTCKAASPLMPNRALQDHATVSVLYPPKLYLQAVGSTSELEEGHDVYFQCIVDANPKPSDILWAHNGIPVEGDSSAGVFVSEWRLVLKNLTRHVAGSYTCAAANTEGAATSKPHQLNVMFAPVCSPKQKSMYGASLQEHLNVYCHVDASPPPSMFKWVLNNSMEVVEVPKSVVSFQGGLSVLQYTVDRPQDYGTLLCQATNHVGSQMHPCVYHILPAGWPGEVRNCHVMHNSSLPRSMALLTCEPGWDGGANQTFTLEVRQARDARVLAAFQHSPQPQFTIRGLVLGEEYLLTVTAVNHRGTSDPVTINYISPLQAALPSHQPPMQVTPSTLTILLAMCTGLLLTLAVVVTVFIAVFQGWSWCSHRSSGPKILYARALRDHHLHYQTNALTANSGPFTKDASGLLRLIQHSNSSGSWQGSATGVSAPHTRLPHNNVCCSDSINKSGSEMEHLLMGVSGVDQTACLAPLASTDSLGHSLASSSCTSISCSTHPSKASSRHPSMGSIGASKTSSSTVALNPDYLLQGNSGHC